MATVTKAKPIVAYHIINCWMVLLPFAQTIWVRHNNVYCDKFDSNSFIHALKLWDSVKIKTVWTTCLHGKMDLILWQQTIFMNAFKFYNQVSGARPLSLPVTTDAIYLDGWYRCYLEVRGSIWGRPEVKIQKWDIHAMHYCTQGKLKFVILATWKCGGWSVLPEVNRSLGLFRYSAIQPFNPRPDQSIYMT